MNTWREQVPFSMGCIIGAVGLAAFMIAADVHPAVFVPLLLCFAGGHGLYLLLLCNVPPATVDKWKRSWLGGRWVVDPLAGIAGHVMFAVWVLVALVIRGWGA